jgi:hypothetical protein
MVWICRILFLLVFALFWGGLTFYTGFVVRISHDVLDDPMDGGLITQRVTAVLQVFGTVTVVLMACNALVIARYSKKCGYALGAIAAMVVCALAGLFVVHGHLDAVIDVAASEITDYDAFKIGHRRYNQLTTIQWLGSLAYLAITVFAWWSIDAGKSYQSDL